MFATGATYHAWQKFAHAQTDRDTWLGCFSVMLRFVWDLFLVGGDLYGGVDRCMWMVFRNSGSIGGDRYLSMECGIGSMGGSDSCC